MYVLWLSGMANVGFTRGRIDQAYQGSVGVTSILTPPFGFDLFFLLQVMMQESIPLIRLMFVLTCTFYLIYLLLSAMVRSIRMDNLKSFSERLSNNLIFLAMRSWSWLRCVVSESNVHFIMLFSRSVWYRFILLSLKDLREFTTQKLPTNTVMSISMDWVERCEIYTKSHVVKFLVSHYIWLITAYIRIH